MSVFDRYVLQSCHKYRLAENLAWGKRSSVAVESKLQPLVPEIQCLSDEKYNSNKQ